jgi:hypothetical protein
LKKVYDYRLNQLIQNETVKDVIKLPEQPKYEENKTYWCGYWHEYYTVVNAEYEKHGKHEHLKAVTVEWKDGRIGTHCTALEQKRDYELIL